MSRHIYSRERAFSLSVKNEGTRYRCVKCTADDLLTSLVRHIYPYID